MDPDERVKENNDVIVDNPPIEMRSGYKTGILYTVLKNNF